MFDLSGKVAVVTGSSRGIGKASVMALAKAGAKVVVSSRKADACAAVVEEIKAAGGVAVAIPANVSRKEELERLVVETERQLGPIDILVCNAAVNPFYGTMGEISDEAFDKIMSTNVKSNLWLCNLVIPKMAARGGGSVIIISSVVGLAGTSNIGAYAISKAADVQLARNYAVEWGHKGVRINCISPGLIKTDFAKALFENPNSEAFIKRLTPLGRPGEPDDIAGPVVFLASDASRFMTAHNLVVDGGVTMATCSFM